MKDFPYFVVCVGRFDHDERDCLQWIRSNVTLWPEEKQFGPWLRSLPEKNQKPQLVMVEKQGEIQSREGGKEVLDRGATGVEVPAPMTMSGH